MIETEDSVEILEAPGQAEGESGSETIGFSTFGAQRINDAQKRRARPCSLEFQWNFTTNVAQRAVPVPVPYRGTFVTSFDGNILAGARLDGAGATTSPWASLFTSDVNGRWSDGVGGNVGLPVLTSTTIGLPGNRCGFDVFVNLSQTNVNVQFSCINIYAMAPPFQFNASIILNKVPQIGSFTPPGAPAGTSPWIITRRRPEGYNAGEDGVQVFASIPYATTTFPPGFISPGAAGVLDYGFATWIVCNITP